MKFKKNSWPRWIVKSLVLLFILHVLALTGFYFFQETALFHPNKIKEEYKFKFTEPFEEVFIPTPDNVNLHGIYFTVQNPIGAVIHYHGNGGTVKTCGQEASLFTSKNYNVLFIDYRGYGKSGGSIQSEEQLIKDGQTIYDFIKKSFDEKDITLVGLSMGTGIATQIAAANHPGNLILLAPFFGLQDLIREKAIVVPERAIRYKFQSHKYLPRVDCPISIVHGKDDVLIPIEHAYRLEDLNPAVTLYEINNCTHRIRTCGQLYKAYVARALMDGR